jgi:hypothetical protein
MGCMKDIAIISHEMLGKNIVDFYKKCCLLSNNGKNQITKAALKAHKGNIF